MKLFYDSPNIFPNNVKKIQFWSILCSIKWAKLGLSHGGSGAVTGDQERGWGAVLKIGIGKFRLDWI